MSKSRLRELGAETGAPTRRLVALPLLIAGAVVAGVIAYRKRPGGEAIKGAVSSFLRSAGAIAAPLLLERLGREMAARAAPPDRSEP